jgi:Fic family protein
MPFRRNKDLMFPSYCYILHKNEIRENDMRITGSYEKLGELNYFVPHKLPPDPPFVMDDETIQKLIDTAFHLGRLNEMSRRLPNIDRFIKAYVLKEAMLSSEIEGIFTTLADVFTTPTNEQQDHDTKLVLNYTKAINTAVSMVKNDELPIVTRVLLKTHEELMRIDESSKSSPGEFRLQSVRVGDFIPPPAFKVPSLIGEWETFVNQDVSLHELIKIGLAHVQFETIHPFLECTVPKTNNLSAAIKNRAPHFQRFAFFC